MNANVGDFVLCPCGEWVEIRRGINALIPAAGHCWHFYMTARGSKRTMEGEFLGRTHHIIPGVDVVRRAA